MKKNNYRYYLLLLFVVTGVLSTEAEIKLPSIFGDHMVLQQKTEASVWGKATAGKVVKLTTSWNRKSYSAIADHNGKWLIKVATPSAGGPYSITISDGKAMTLNDVLIGEVWICSGQSNMQMTMKGYNNEPVIGSNEAIAASTNNNIRLYTVERDKSLLPAEDFRGEWLECLPGNVADFSAVAYFFGKMIQHSLKVPVGLICSSYGGTRIEPWISEDGFNEYDWIKMPEKSSKDDYSIQTPTVLFNAMIAPMVGFAFRGCLWYQGESNWKEPERYEKLMQGMVKNWRKQWSIGDFPFYYVQIAPFGYVSPFEQDPLPAPLSALLREAQLKASAAIPNSGMVSLLDIGEKRSIHPPRKKEVGERLAFLALAKTYGFKGVEYSGPVLKDMIIEGQAVKLTFDHAEKGLTTFGKELENFSIAGENKRFFPAKAYITGKGITLLAPQVEKPVAVRYAFDDFVTGTLYNTNGLPASSFRTDNW
ncbi:MAG: sialate O-acetylesterase [Chitinophagaceae bacterium]|nr:sialate O-acetylesterase [Chitinophagaceae bacterium]